MNLLPKPKRVEPGQGTFAFGISTAIRLTFGTAPGALLYAQMLQQTLEAETGLHCAILRGAARDGMVNLEIDPAQQAGRYTLTVTPARVTVAAGDDEALCNGVQTLRQLIEGEGAALPAQQIEDWPDMAHRGYYFDCSRGRVPKLSYLKQVADRLCRYKINEWQLYIEHTYLFENLSEAWRDDTPLTAQEILELDDYCAARHF